MCQVYRVGVGGWGDHSLGQDLKEGHGNNICCWLGLTLVLTSLEVLSEKIKKFLRIIILVLRYNLKKCCYHQQFKIFLDARNFKIK